MPTTLVGNDIIALVTGGVLEQKDIITVDDTFYNEMAATAEEMINEYGRNVTFLRFDQNPGDSDKPWNGPTNPRTAPSASAIIKAVFVPPGGAASLGMRTVDEDLLKRSEEICIVAPGVSSPPFDLATANEIKEDTLSRKVVFVETLKPADVVLLYFIGIQR